MRALPVMLLALSACRLDNGLSLDPDGRGGADSEDTGTGSSTDSEEYNPLGEACNGEDDDGDGDVDEGWPDANANGVADCLDPSCPALHVGEEAEVPLTELCAGEGVDTNLPLEDAWQVREQWQFFSPARYPNAYWSLAQPVVGNLDDDNGDGVIDEEDTPEVAVNLMDALENTQGVIVVLDGETGEEKWTWEGSLATAGIIIADVDANGRPDVVSFDSAAVPVALTGSGARLWRGEDVPGSPYYPLVSVADLDADGRPEVIADDLVLDGVTGRTLFSLGLGDADPYRMAAVGDFDQDGDQEIAMAGEVFDSDGTRLWSTGEHGTYGFWPVVINADDDEEAEIGFVGERWTLWEADGAEIYSTSYGVAQPGPPCAGDFDGDGEAEVAWPAYHQLVMYELNGEAVWASDIDDESGLAGCSGFDVDGDGALEVLYADETAFRILDGATGTPRYATGTHRSGTVFEYPTVADIDHDGHAEIVITSNMYTGDWGAVTAFEHDGDGWPESGSTWGVHDFAVTNINPDGSVPALPVPPWLEYNLFRARPASDSIAPPDLVVMITDLCVLDCVAGPVSLALQVTNQGGENVPAGTWLSLYADEGDGQRRWIMRYAMPALPAKTALEGFEVALTPADLGANGLVAVIDDDGTGSGTVAECDEDNNENEWNDVECE